LRFAPSKIASISNTTMALQRWKKPPFQYEMRTLIAMVTRRGSHNHQCITDYSDVKLYVFGTNFGDPLCFFLKKLKLFQLVCT